LQGRPKKFYVRTISMHWNYQQGRLIYHQIEHMCDLLDQCVRERHNVNNVAELRRVRQQDWNQIIITSSKIIRRMRRQCIAVAAADGGHANYSIKIHILPFFFCDIFRTKITIDMILYLLNGYIHKNLDTNFLYLVMFVILY
jgi:hypothetical protein